MTPRRQPLAAALAAVVLALSAPQAPAQVSPALPGAEPATPAATPEPETAASLEARRAKLTEELAALRASLEKAGNRSEPRLLARLDLLDRLDRTLARRSAVLRELERLAATPASPADLLGAGPPYSLALLDAASQSLQAHRTQRRSDAEREQKAREEVTRLAEELDARERARRQAREALESAQDAVAGAELEEKLRQARLESDLAQERLALARSEAQLAGVELEQQGRRIALLEATRDRIRDGLELTRFDLDEPLQRLALEEETVRSKLERAQAALAAADRRLEDVRKRAEGPGEAAPELRAELEARRAERQAAQWQVAVHETRLQQIETLRKTWQRRWEALAGEAPEETVLQWQQELDGELDELRRQQRIAATREAELARDLEALRKTEPGAADTPWQEERVQALEHLGKLYTESRDQSALLGAELERALADLRAVTDTKEPGEGIREILARARGLLGRELFVIDDRSITVAKLALALLLFVMGFSLSRALARLTGRFVYGRVKAPGAAYAFERLTFYGLLVVFFLIALRLVSIPLTAFALLGGALAIGLGFGSQNVINNFISGLILLVERPMKVGDIVDVEGVSGFVERVGPRSTRIRTFDNLHIIVPNSSFLEQNVVNWTLSDLTIRRNVTVGVAYGTDTREAGRLILRALAEHGRILDKPEPKVFFADFGDNALVFRAFFWLQLQPNTSFFEIESDVRHRINHLLRDARITVAFPQRDVHLDTLQPLEVRVLGRDDGKDAG